MTKKMLKVFPTMKAAKAYQAELQAKRNDLEYQIGWSAAHPGKHVVMVLLPEGYNPLRK